MCDYFMQIDYFKIELQGVQEIIYNSNQQRIKDLLTTQDAGHVRLLLYTQRFISAVYYLKSIHRLMTETRVYKKH